MTAEVTQAIKMEESQCVGEQESENLNLKKVVNLSNHNLSKAEVSLLSKD